MKDYLKITDLKKDKVMAALLIMECLIAVYLLARAFVGAPYELSFSGAAFFDNIKGHETIHEDGTDVVIEAMPEKRQEDLEHGINIYSYEFALRSGAYTAEVEYVSEGGETIEYMLDANGYLGIRSVQKESTVKYEPLYLDDSHQKVSGRFYVPVFSSVSDLQLFVHYDGPGSLRIKSIVFSEKKIYRFMQILGLLFCFAVSDLVYYFLLSPLYMRSGFDPVKKQKDRTALGVLLTVVFTSAPLFIVYLYSGHDILFHLNRIEGIAAAMRYHRLPVRIQSDLLLGYGYNVPLYYCDILLYPSAFLYEYCMLPLRLSYQLYIFAINCLTAYTSWRCCRTLTDDGDMAAFGMFMYTASAYRLTDIYLRSAVGEFTAFAFLPLVLEGMYRIYITDKPKLRDWMPLALGMGFLLQSHVISSLVTVFFILIFMMAAIRKLTLKRFIAMVKAAILAFGLCAWFLVPMLESLIKQRPVVTEISTRIQWTGAYLTQLFELLPGGYGISREGTVGDMPLGIGGGLTMGFFLLAAYFILRNKDADRDNDSLNARVLVYGFGLGTLALWMSTVYFPRDIVSRILIGRLDPVRSLWEVMELVWRHLMVATLMLTVAVTALLCVIRRRREKLLIPLIASMILLTVISDMSFYHGVTENSRQFSYIQMDNDRKAYMDMSADFDLVWGMTRRILDTSVITGTNDIKVISYENDGADRILSCVNRGSEGDVILPLFDFGNYHAVDTGSGAELATKRSDVNARLAVSIPSGFEGTLKVFYREPFYWRILELVSVVSWGFVLLCILLSAKGVWRKNRD